MFSFHLFKRQANRRGIFLLVLFFLYAVALMIPTVKELKTEMCGWWWKSSHLLLILMLTVSLITPVISLIKPGFSYKGHPGMRHSSLLVAASFPRYLTNNQLILYSLILPLHGVHCLTIYSSLFKGPTSKFGKIYQPFLPIIE